MLPVTFGGGNIMENFPFGLSFLGTSSLSFSRFLG
jgi:hypothetical protein